MHHAQMDLIHGGGVVVDQADAADMTGAADLDFLFQLAPHAASYASSVRPPWASSTET